MGKAPESTQMFLPCGHFFDVAYLDDNFGLRNAYDMDDAGNAKGVAREKLIQVHNTSLECPTCGASCKNIRRYAIVDRMKSLKDTIDRAQANFSRRTHQVLAKCSEIGSELRNTFGNFQRGLQPGPLAARQNERMVLQRGNAPLELETLVVQLRGLLHFPPF